MLKRPDEMRFKEKVYAVHNGRHFEAMGHHDFKYASNVSQVETFGGMLFDHVDESLSEQPFLPKRPHVVAKCVSLFGCMMNVYDTIRILKGEHHSARRWRYDRIALGPATERLIYGEDGTARFENCWYVYGGKLLKIPTDDPEKLLAFDALFMGSPEVRYLNRRYHH